MEKLKVKINKAKTFTQAEYAREKNISPQLLTYWIKVKKVKTIQIRGGVLIIDE